MAPPAAWILNLDAEYELERLSGYTRSSALGHLVGAATERLLGFLAPGDVVIDPAREPGAYRGYAGAAWCATPSALRAIEASGACAPPAPAVDVLRTVNHRAFPQGLAPSLPHACFVRSHAALDALLTNHAPPFGAWLLKRPFGFAGRGRLRVTHGQLDAASRAWINASLARKGGLRVEPWVERVADFAIHGCLRSSGEVERGALTMQLCDASGAWQRSEVSETGALSSGEHDALTMAFEATAGALRAAGYWGPFGIDAFAWRDGRGVRQFNALGEVNARFSMGWAVGAGGGFLRATAMSGLPPTRSTRCRPAIDQIKQSA